MQPDYRKIAILVLLLVPCIWLVRRNLFPPSASSAASVTTAGSALADRESPPGAAAGRRAGASKKDPQALDFDPTIREDLLEASRAVEYQGSSRNIFEFHSPPPLPPLELPPLLPSPEETFLEPAPPPAPTIALKFYGTAQRPGGPRRAFLTDGDEILIAQEGDVVANFYKVNRIGVTSLELEDTRSQQTQEIPLIEE
jgi:hypothetical protein